MEFSPNPNPPILSTELTELPNDCVCGSERHNAALADGGRWRYGTPLIVTARRWTTPADRKSIVLRIHRMASVLVAGRTLRMSYIFLQDVAAYSLYHALSQCYLTFETNSKNYALAKETLCRHTVQAMLMYLQA